MEPLITERDEAVGILTLNRPDKRNALSKGMIAALGDGLREMQFDPGIRVVILRANGPAFCAGHDLSEMSAWREANDGGAEAYQFLFQGCSELMKGIVQHPKPIIAEIDGPAFAAGCQLVASCDLAYASERARFATPGVRIGLFCSTPMVALSRNVSRKHAMEMLLTGDAVDAPQAASLGLINRCLPSNMLRGEVEAVARLIAERSPAAIRYGKRSFYDQLENDLDEAYAQMGRIMTENMLAADAKEGIGAFLEKREPIWPASD